MSSNQSPPVPNSDLGVPLYRNESFENIIQSEQPYQPLSLPSSMHNVPISNPPNELPQNPFATPLPSQKATPVASTTSTPYASTTNLQSLGHQGQNLSTGTLIRGHIHNRTNIITQPDPVHLISRRSSGSSKEATSNEIIRDQFPELLQGQPESTHQALLLPTPTTPPIPPQIWTRGPGFWRSFIAICVPLLLSALEGSVTNTALPTISEALDLGTMFSWVATAFLLASTIFQPLYGQLADIWGRKYPMMLAVFIFAAGSAICGWANSGAVLLLGRIVQGLGTGGIDLFAELILSDLVPLRQRGTYMSIKHGVFATGTTVGPLLGGIFAEHGWRWCFWINLPVSGLSIILMFFWINVGSGSKRGFHMIDGWGTTLLTSAVVLILVGLSIGGASYPWSHPAILCPLVFGGIGLAVFPFWECSKWCSSPITPPYIFKNRTSATAFTLTAIHGFLTYGVQFFLPPFFQAVKGSSPIQSGIQVLPTTLVIVVMAALGGPVLSYFGKYRPIHQVGFVCMTLGLGLCTMMAQNTPVIAWVMFQLVFAFGSGIVVSTMLPAIQVELHDEANGAAAGSWAFLRGAGSLFGVAIPSAIFNLRFSRLLAGISNAEARSRLANGQAYQRTSAHFVNSFGPAVRDQIISVFTDGLKAVWITFTIIAGIGLCLTTLERQVKMRKELNTVYGLKNPKENKLDTREVGMMTPAQGCVIDIEK